MLGSTRVRKSKRRTVFEPKKRPTQERARATWDAILSATTRILARDGYEELTTNHVAEAAGVSIGTLYEWFPDKETIVAELVRTTIDGVMTAFEQALDHALTTERGSWRVFIRAVFDGVNARRDAVRVVWKEVPFLDDLPEVSKMRERIIELASRAEVVVTNPVLLENGSASIYLVATMSAHAVVESVVARPPALGRAEVEETFGRIFEDLLTGGARTPRGARSRR